MSDGRKRQSETLGRGEPFQHLPRPHDDDLLDRPHHPQSVTISRALRKRVIDLPYTTPLPGSPPFVQVGLMFSPA